MTNDPNNGGDIASGFGDSTVTGPVSDEKAEQMKQRAAANAGPPASESGDAEGEQDDADD